MKKLFIVLFMCVSLVMAGNAMACYKCKPRAEVKFAGEGFQVTGVNLLKGKTDMVKIDGEKVEVLTDGAMGYATESSEFKFKGSADSCYGGPCGLFGGFGAGVTVGGSSLWGENTKNTAWVAGVTGSGTVVGGISTGDFSAKMKGEGEMGTMAIKEKGNNLAFAASDGAYKYSGTLNGSGVIAGAGLTAGGSYVNNSTVNGVTNVSAVSGQTTIAGAGGITPRFIKHIN